MSPECSQPSGVIAGRVAEHRAAARLPHRLQVGAAREQFLDSRAGNSSIAGLQPQLRGDEPFTGRPLHAAISDRVLIRPAPRNLAAPIDRVDGLHQRPGLAAEGTRVHREGTAHGPRYADQELGPDQARIRAMARDLGAGSTGAGLNDVAVHGNDVVKRGVGGDHAAADPAVAHQQVAAEADPQYGLVRRQSPQIKRKILEIRGLVKMVGRTAHAPRGMARHRFIATQDAAQRRRAVTRLGRLVQRHHAAPPARN